VRTNHYSLKFLLDQRLSTIPQHTWVSKLFGYDFSVEFNPNKNNTVTDALSWRDEDTMSAQHLSSPAFALYNEFRHEAEHLSDVTKVKDDIAQGTTSSAWSLVHGLVLHDGRVFVPESSALWPQILAAAHDAGTRASRRHSINSGRPSTTRMPHDWCGSSSSGAPPASTTSEQLHPAGLLHPLEVPSSVWADITMDFVEGFLRVGGKSVVLTVVNRFSKYAHFITLGHPYTAVSVACAFSDNIVRLHDMPCSIVSDRDPVFTSKFWEELLSLAGITLRMSTTFHPPDGRPIRGH
jgi:hypothetical protein